MPLSFLAVELGGFAALVADVARLTAGFAAPEDFCAPDFVGALVAAADRLTAGLLLFVVAMGSSLLPLVLMSWCAGSMTGC